MFRRRPRNSNSIYVHIEYYKGQALIFLETKFVYVYIITAPFI